MQVIVTAKNGGGEATGVSKRTAVVAPLAPSVVETKGPTISGEARDEKTLTAENGTWKGTPTITFTYQWQICNSLGRACNNISGATSSTYKLTPTEVGDTLQVIVTAENAGGKASATSEKTAVVVAGPAGQRKAPEDQRHRRGRRNPDGRNRHLEGHPDDHLRLPVGALQQIGRSLQQHLGRHLLHLRAEPDRSRRHPAGHRHRRKRRRKASATSEQTPVVTPAHR